MAVEQTWMTEHGPHLSRRTVLALGAATVFPNSALSAAPQRLKLGEFDIIVLSDGHLTVPTRLSRAQR
jgi:hypothetical protein